MSIEFIKITIKVLNLNELLEKFEILIFQIIFLYPQILLIRPIKSE